MSREILKPDKEFAEKITAIQQVDTAIRELLGIDFINPSLEDVKKAFYKDLAFLPISAMPIEKTILEGLTIFRARVIDDKKEDITRVETFGAPSPDKCNDFGRANWPKKPVFYGADRPFGALAELKRLDVGNEFYISKWDFDMSKTSNKYIPITPILFSEMSKTNPWHALMENETNPYQELIDEFGQEKADSLKHLYDEICKLYASANTKHYPITAYISHQHLYSNPPEDNLVSFPIIIYPSVENELESCNFAIHPMFVRTYMRATKFMHVKVTENAKKKLTVSCLRIGISENGKTINWYSFLANDAESKYKVNFIGCPGCGKLYFHEDFDKLEFKYKNNPINLNQIVENIIVPFQNSPFNTLPQEFMVSMKFQDSYLRKFVFESGNELTMNCGSNTHISPCINMSALIKFKYEALNINPPEQI